MPSRNMEDIALYIKGMKFKRRLFGVDEKDVFEQLELLQKEYRNAFQVMEERYKAKLEEKENQLLKYQKWYGQARQKLRKFAEEEE